MNSSGFLRLLLVSTGLLLAFAAAAGAGPGGSQRTGDGMTPAEETVCDGDPFFGLCNAYCEALDCDSGENRTPAAERSCQRVLNNYFKKTGGVPPCECPCPFNLGADIQQVEAQGIPYPDPADVGPECNDVDSIGESFEWDAEVSVAQPLDASIFYQVLDPAVGQAQCGRILEIQTPEGQDTILETEFVVLSPDEVGACFATLDFVCDSPNVTDNRTP